MTAKNPTNSKERKYSLLGIKLKEEEGEFYSEGFIATTHPDRAADESIGVDGDILSKQSCQQIVDFINSGVATVEGVGSTRTVSLQHDWIKEGNPNKEPAGIVVPPAELKEMEDGHYGVWVKVHHNKAHPEFEDIKYKVQNGYLPGYSIEYVPGESSKVNFEGKIYRFLKTITNYVGHAFASARLIANPAALITSMGYKELEEIANKDNKSEENNMSEEEIKPSEPVIEEPKAEPVVEEPAPVVEEPKVEEVKEEPVIEEPEVKEIKLETPSIKEIVAKEVSEALDSLKVESKVMNNKGEAPMNINIKQLNDALVKGELVSAKEASQAYAEETDILYKAVGDPASYTTGFKMNLNVKCVGKGLKISPGFQTKDTLVIGDNASSYTQQNVELADVFAPGIIDTFNNQTNLFGFLKKEQHVGGEYCQWKMVTNKNPNSSDTFVSRTDVTVTKNFSSKLNYRTPLKIARRGVSVSDFINRYSARSLPDLFMLELDLQMTEMMNDVNAALFAEVADGTGNSPLGLEAVADSAGNTTLYGLSRSTANRLAPDAAGNTYTAVGGAITEAAIRLKMTNLEVQGTKFGDIAIVTSPTVRDFLFNLLDGNRRWNTTEASFGFNKANVPSYDGIPIIVDSDCNADGLYIIDTSAQGDVIVVGMPPQIVQLAKVGAAVEAYVQMDFAHVYKQPRRIGMLDTITS